MALHDEKDHRVEITADEFARLQQMLRDDNRLGMYLRLHTLSGSQAALDMAEISTSSGVRGGTAWALNEAYTRFVPGYPKEGVAHFSRKIAHGDLDLIQERYEETGRYLIPTDLEMYEGARKTWNKMGDDQVPPVPGMGDHYFPGLAVLTAHYAEMGVRTGNFGALAKHVQETESWKPAIGGLAASTWETFTELVADNHNRSQSINDLLEQRPDLRPRSLKSPTGDDVIVFENAQGKPEHITRVSAGRNRLVDFPVSLAEKVADGLASYRTFEQFNRFGSGLSQRIPTPTEIRELLNEKLDALRGRHHNRGDGAHREPAEVTAPDVRGNGRNKAASERDSQVLLDDPANQDHGLYRQVLASAVKLRRSDRSPGGEPDQTDRQLSAALAAKCKEQGMTCVNHVMLSLDGRRVFAVDTPNLATEWRKRADVDVTEAVRQPLDVSTGQMAHANRELARQMETERQRDRGPEDPTRGGPVMA